MVRNLEFPSLFVVGVYILTWKQRFVTVNVSYFIVKELHFQNSVYL